MGLLSSLFGKKDNDKVKATVTIEAKKRLPH